MKTHLANGLTTVAFLAITCMVVLHGQAPAKPGATPGKPARQTGGQAKPLFGAGPTATDLKTLAAKPTPKRADGHPNLDGRWLARPPVMRLQIGTRVDGKVHDLYFGTPIDTADPTKDPTTTKYGTEYGTGEEARRERQAINKPSYKPEF